MTTTPMMTGDTIGSALAWRWDKTHSRWWATAEDGAMLVVGFNKVGGRGSGKKNGKSYWTATIDGHRVLGALTDPVVMAGVPDGSLAKASVYPLAQQVRVTHVADRKSVV